MSAETHAFKNSSFALLLKYRQLSSHHSKYLVRVAIIFSRPLTHPRIDLEPKFHTLRERSLVNFQSFVYCRET